MTVAALATVAAWLRVRVVVPPPETMVVPSGIPVPVMVSPLTVLIAVTARVVEAVLAAVVVVESVVGMLTPETFEPTGATP